MHFSAVCSSCLGKFIAYLASLAQTGSALSYPEPTKMQSIYGLSLQGPHQDLRRGLSESAKSTKSTIVTATMQRVFIVIYTYVIYIISYLILHYII